MAGTINKVILIGHLGDEVKMHYFDNGNSIGRFPLATNETYTKKDTGEKITNVDWHNVVVRNKLAEVCEKYLKKGDKVYVEGKLKNRTWEQEGQKKHVTEIHLHEMTMLSTKNSSNSSNKTQTSPPPQHQEHDDDLPF